MVEETTQARQVIEELATERGYTLEALAEEIVGHGHHKRDKVAVHLVDARWSDPIYLRLVKDIFSLSEEEYRQYWDAIMADCIAWAESLGLPEH